MKPLNTRDVLRAIPPINEILEDLSIAELVRLNGRNLVLENLRGLIELTKKEILENDEFCNEWNICSKQDMKEYIGRCLLKITKNYEMSGLKKVINATGIVLHTNLGRAPLPKKAIESIVEVSRGYSNIEYDLAEGKRGSRHSHVETILQQITGAEDGMIVNNNAAAVFLCLNTFANQREVIISRGEQVEIGGSFRIPDIITGSGCSMVEVGTTNKTHLSDFERAYTENTAVLLKVHTSNYKVTGFTHEVPLIEMAEFGKKNDVIVMEDLGSGCLIDLSGFGIPYEQTVQDCVKDGADLVTFSGDKLLGGPQAGIIVGKKKLIDELKKNPLARMVRCDKTTIAAMRGVLDLYLEPDRAVNEIPAIRMMGLKAEELQIRALKLQDLIHFKLGSFHKTEIVEELEEIGGGSLPGVLLKGKAVTLIPYKMSVNEVQDGLRTAKHPVVCRISQDKLVFHVRTTSDEEIPLIVESLKEILGGKA